MKALLRPLIFCFPNAICAAALRTFMNNPGQSRERIDVVTESTDNSGPPWRKIALGALLGGRCARIGARGRRNHPRVCCVGRDAWLMGAGGVRSRVRVSNRALRARLTVDAGGRGDLRRAPGDALRIRRGEPWIRCGLLARALRCAFLGRVQARATSQVLRGRSGRGRKWLQDHPFAQTLTDLPIQLLELRPWTHESGVSKLRPCVLWHAPREPSVRLLRDTSLATSPRSQAARHPIAEPGTTPPPSWASPRRSASRP